jgi:putative MATE family efflux protein
MVNHKNFLGTESVYKLLPMFAIPTIISGLVGAVYNIVDQIFIGRIIGILGNAATNVAFPIVLLCTAVSIMAGVGCSAGFNMASGRGDTEEAGRFVGASIELMVIVGLLISLLTVYFLDSLVYVFGSTDTVYPYAATYLGIIALGVPLAVFGTGGSIIIRSDGSPKYALLSVTVGAVLNIVLDGLFMLVFQWGIAGAAWGTVIGQAVTALLVWHYFTAFKTIPLKRAYFYFRPRYMQRIAALGMGPFINHSSMFLVQLLLNNSLNHYGGLSVYGSDIPLAGVGVIIKVNTIFTAVVIGIAQGVQPIISFNFGAGNFARVRAAAKLAIEAMLAFSFLFFLSCQLIPRQLMAIFGNGPELYFRFGERYLRIFMFFVCLNGLQITAGNIFTSMGKARLSVFISLTRQVLFLPPLIVLLPLWLGIDGVLYAGPAADFACIAVAMYLLWRENNHLQDSPV